MEQLERIEAVQLANSTALAAVLATSPNARAHLEARLPRLRDEAHFHPLTDEQIAVVMALLAEMIGKRPT